MGKTEPNLPEGIGPPHNPGLKKLIEAKREWHHRPDAEAGEQGFLGWHERGYLPHFDAPNVTQFVTFLLRDAFPVTRRREWELLLREGNESIRKRKLEAWLDRGHGECWLRRPDVAAQVEQVLRAEDGQTYCLRAWTLMPNHVHLVVDVWQTPLSSLLQLCYTENNPVKAGFVCDSKHWLWGSARFRDEYECLPSERTVYTSPSAAG